MRVKVLESVDEFEDFGYLDFGVLDLGEFEVGLDGFEVGEFKNEGREVWLAGGVPLRER